MKHVSIILSIFVYLLVAYPLKAQVIDFEPSTVVTGDLGNYNFPYAAGQALKTTYPQYIDGWTTVNVSGNWNGLRIENGVTRAGFFFNKALRYTLPWVWIMFGPLAQGTFTFTLLTGDNGVFSYGRADVFVYDSALYQIGSPQSFLVNNNLPYSGMRVCQVSQYVPQGGYVRIQRPIILRYSGDFFIDAISAAGGPVPVELVSFSAYEKGNRVELKWTTATELNNFGFEIERSIDRESWEPIGFVLGFGTTASPKDYAFIDATPERTAKVSYYRLKQQDRDGSIEYSDVLRVSRPVAGELSLRAYPLPFATQLTVEINLVEPQAINLKLYNSAMQEVREIHVGTIDGSMTVTVPTYDLQAGTYFLVMHKADGQSQVLKLLRLATSL